MSVRPLDDIRALLQTLPAPPAPQAATGLGRLNDLTAFLARWRGRPAVNRPILALYAGSVGRDPEAVRAGLEAVAAGASPAAAIAQATGAGLEAFDLAIDRPVGDMNAGAAMSERECAATMAFGMEALAKQPDFLMLAVLTDDGGQAAAALSLALFGGQASDWLAEGDASVASAAERAKAESAGDPLDLLRQLGGRQMAAAAGAIVAARTQSIPVLIDGYSALAAAAALQAAQPGAIDHCLAAHAGGTGQARLLQRMGLTPILDLGLPDEGGVGALTALQVVKAAAAV